MKKHFSNGELEAYLDEALPVGAMAELESAARADGTLVEQLAAINARRDAGVHSLAEIWRRNRLSCPTRQQLGSYLLDVLPKEEAAYIRFHLEEIGCRQCRANIDDLQTQQEDASSDVDSRRRKYFQSSAGYLRRGQ